ncbi:trypsin-like peptidase domain-containing protein [Paractinoplanes rishiriensis]|uniref:Effector-associated domain-containing protein n=1 Tax=Paractinoplanes rishiriensis TaxID=1050105 RepID=A0A919KBI1_9ACTN|nr:trypsin-like peptidase domain-containing protein [Actinoplanes rishiriensis]GIF02124.1 hypothetical protein Ari01nite_95880 [Actinoplanes rishiriensis]
MAPPRLSGPQQRELQEALAAIFDRDQLEQFLLYRLNIRLEDISPKADNLQSSLFRVLEHAKRRLWWRDLVVEARNELPEDAGLIMFAQRVGLAPAVTIVGDHTTGTPSPRQLQLQIREAGSTLDFSQYLRRAGAVEGRVCRVEYPRGEAHGTGFLVGPTTAITNYHVMEHVLRGRIDPRHVVLRFDYRTDSDGVTVRDGTVYRMAADWLVDASPYSPADLTSGSQAQPAPDELDYVIMRVDGTPGHDPIGGETDDPRPPRTRRGWIEIPAREHDFDRDPALNIVQHPEGRPIQIALDTHAVIGRDPTGIRIRYTTTTAPGSSGSPCFSLNWQWVALHHSGDPKYWQGGPASYNQGIPVTAIRDLAVARGADWALGG